MRFALAALLIAACAPRAKAPSTPADPFGSFLGNTHVSRGPADPNAPLAKDADVTEGGGPISMVVGPAAPGTAVTPTVGEKPDTLEQAKGPPTTPAPAPPTGPVTGTTTPTPTNPGPTTSTTPPR